MGHYDDEREELPIDNCSFMKVKLLHENAIVPQRAHSTDAGLDVFCVENCVVMNGSDAIIKTGISMSLPDGWVAIVKEKSGIATKKKLTVGACVIDSSYRGEILINLFNHGSIPATFNIGEKIAQLVIVPCWCGQPVEVEELDETERGAGKFGSTGIAAVDKLCGSEILTTPVEHMSSREMTNKINELFDLGDSIQPTERPDVESKYEW
jgi:dUTP pyrophosphatase